jgi:phage FluMu protein Com
MICPQCRSANCFRSHRDGILDLCFSAFGLRPWRCHTCDKRFYAARVAWPFLRYAHCPRCGNFDLEHIPRNRAEHGTFLLAKRFFRLPAYRCDPCRQRFFSILPPRRIVSSTVLPEHRSVQVGAGN